jgi:glutaredoxin 2
MENKLYHYVHCPFCVRVRLALGFLKVPYESIVVPYDDEETPTKMCGVKMLPIMSIGATTNMNESLDIIDHFDESRKLHRNFDLDEVNELLSALGKPIHNLAMPYWIYTPEFNDSSREYFSKKKEAKRGPFKNLMQPVKKNELMNQALELISKLSDDLNPYYKSEHFGLADILIASHLWGLYVVPEFQFPAKVHTYLQSIRSLCDFDYHGDFWR